MSGSPATTKTRGTVTASSALVRRYSEISELTYENVHEFIDRILVHELDRESNSIQHQIEILTKYCKDHAISRYQIYKDDGFSGTNFARPHFSP